MLKENADIKNIKAPCPDCLLKKPSKVTRMRRLKRGQFYCPVCRKRQSVLLEFK